jgi:hypothetical protein
LPIIEDNLIILSVCRSSGRWEGEAGKKGFLFPGDFYTGLLKLPGVEEV